MRPLSSTAQRVQRALAAAGVEATIVEHAVPARTSAEAAAVLGCTPAEIAKSLVFRAGESMPVLVIASGANRVDERKVEAAIGMPVSRADPAFVRASTGFAIGGIPPVAHATAPVALIDRDLMRYDRVFAAGGTPHAMFPIRPADLVRISGGRVEDVALRPPAPTTTDGGQR